MQLPVEEVIPELIDALKSGHSAVLEAPPGAGKTTYVPLALLKAGLAGSAKIYMLEPRRLAVRAAAERMSQLLGQKVGEQVGYRIRGESRVSNATRIEVLTEGILARLLQVDPGLTDAGVVIFDEFHERNIDSDLGLALSLYGREIFREDNNPLKILVMSATLDGSAVAKLLNDAPVISSKGRSFPVDIHYLSSDHRFPTLEQSVVAVIKKAIDSHSGSVLVFLPGKKEIEKTRQLISELYKDNASNNIQVFPLHGDMPLKEQRKAIAAVSDQSRKIVLATSIAESSLTIEGVRVVVDSGLSRLPAFDSRTALTRLITQRASRASADQRAGRAGRLEPGVCYRLWTQSQQDTLSAYAPAQVTQADLAPLALALYQFGVNHPQELQWLDAPPAGAYAQAEALLKQLGALGLMDNDSLQLTAHGGKMAQLPAHPRLAHMLILSLPFALLDTACRLAALLSAKDPIRDQGADISLRLSFLKRPNSAGPVIREILKLAQQFKNQVDHSVIADRRIASTDIGFLVACAYPDRIARRRGQTDYQLANGRAVRLRADDPLQQYEWLAVAHAGGHSSGTTDTIYLAAELHPDLFDDELSYLVTEHTLVDWPAAARSLTAERQWRVGHIVLKSDSAIDIPVGLKLAAVRKYIRKQGLQILPWTDELQSFRDRVAFVRSLPAKSTESQANWPDLSDVALLQNLESWLQPWLDNVSHVNHFSELNLAQILDSLLSWELKTALDELAPVKFKVPSGSRLRIDYSDSPPVLSVKLQEMLGCSEHPMVGRSVPLKISLLSPAGRQIQLTQDIRGFWTGSYVQVKKDMKSRYPKHYWPDDPAVAEASIRTTKKHRS